MAVNLTVALNDAEQAYIVSHAAKIAPGMTGPQLKIWAETFCKNALREKVMQVVYAAELEAQSANILTTLNTGWPILQAATPAT